MQPLRVSALCLLLACMALGCSDSIEPLIANDGDGYDDFQGEIDPTGNSFVFARIEIPSSDGIPVRVDLIGRLDIRVPIQPGQIPIAVSVRNVDRRTLFPPGEIILSHFRPVSVFPVAGNPDWTTCPRDPSVDSTAVGPETECNYGYDYSNLLGDDGVLSPGETSGERIWIFWDPDRVPFSFAAHARFSLEPDRPSISGVFFADPNRNGVREASEPPFGGGAVHVTGPGIKRIVEVREDGRYGFHVSEPGIYNLRGVAPPTFAPVVFTTPNPLEVLLLAGSDGHVQGFHRADFGIANELTHDFPLVRFVESTERLPLDPYRLLGAEVKERVMHLRVGFSGCSPDHDFQLYMVGGFRESFPVQARLVLDHDSRGEVCRAYFEKDLAYDLRPILRTYQEQYGEPGVVILRFEDWSGEIHTFELR